MVFFNFWIAEYWIDLLQIFAPFWDNFCTFSNTHRYFGTFSNLEFRVSDSLSQNHTKTHSNTLIYCHLPIWTHWKWLWCVFASKIANHMHKQIPWILHGLFIDTIHLHIYILHANEESFSFGLLLELKISSLIFLLHM